MKLHFAFVYNFLFFNCFLLTFHVTAGPKGESSYDDNVVNIAQPNIKQTNSSNTNRKHPLKANFVHSFIAEEKKTDDSKTKFLINELKKGAKNKPRRAAGKRVGNELPEPRGAPKNRGVRKDKNTISRRDAIRRKGVRDVDNKRPRAIVRRFDDEVEDERENKSGKKSRLFNIKSKLRKVASRTGKEVGNLVLDHGMKYASKIANHYLGSGDNEEGSDEEGEEGEGEEDLDLFGGKSTDDEVEGEDGLDDEAPELEDEDGDENDVEGNNGEEELDEDAETEVDPEETEEDEDAGDYKTPSGLEYLGAGYDLFKGNPLGDSVTLLDPGYRSSVIQMHWRLDNGGISNSLEFLQPIGGWIRPYTSCHKVETVTEISSSDAYLKALSADANVSLALPGDALKFSASANFKQIQDTSKSQDKKLYINKSYCFKYVAGMSTALKWSFTLGFEAALSRLGLSFDGLSIDSGCKPSVYRTDPRNDACIKLGINPWIELFETFGTHVTTRVYLGGKTFSTLEVNKNQEERLKERGINVSAMLSSKIKKANVDSSVEVSVLKSKNNSDDSLDTKKTSFVVGGDIYGNGRPIDFHKWAESVSDHSMPIKAEYTPIVQFLHPRYKNIYNRAYVYYGMVLNEEN